MDKIDRLLDAIEHQDRYSEQEVEAMLADPEVKEVYDMLDKTKSSLYPISAPDIEAEWKKFERCHRKRNFNIFNLFSRNVAAGIAIGIASVAAVAAVVGVGVSYVSDKNVDAAVENNVTVAEEYALADTLVATSEMSDAVPETVVFDNEQFETIVQAIAEYYGYKAEFSTDIPKSLRLYFRWNRAQTLDEVVESLNNFEQINICVKGKTINID